MAQQVLSNIGDYVLTKNDTAYNNVSSINSYTEVIGGEDTNRFFLREFRYSIDGTTFSAWLELTNEYVVSISLDSTSPLYIEIKYSRTGIDDTGDLTFDSVELDFTYTIPEETITNPDWLTTITCSQPSDFIIDEPSTYDPYNLSTSFEMYDKLSQVVGDLYGHCVDYYRTEPIATSKDVILNEYSLYDVSCKDSIKILPIDNVFPSNENTFERYGMGFESWEIHIVKGHFESVFGSTKKPQKNDYLYVPLDDRLWQIDSAYLETTFNNQGTYYRVRLVKYEEKAMISMPDEIRTEMNDISVTYEDNFAVDKQEEYDHIIKPLQYDVISTGDDDLIRSSLNKFLEFNEEDLFNNYTVISKFNYRLEVLDPLVSAVTYRTQIKEVNIPNKSYTTWFRTNIPLIQGKITITDIVSEVGGTQATVTTLTDHGYAIDDLLELRGTNDWSGVYRIISVPTTNTILIEHATAAPLSGNVDTNIYTKKQAESYLLWGHEGNEGLSFKTFETGIIVINNEVEHIFDVPTLPADTWVGLVVNMSTTFNQLSISLNTIQYTQPTPGAKNLSNKLISLYKETVDLNWIDATTEDYFQLVGGSLMVTNIRLFNKLIDEEQISSVLNQYVVNNSELLLMLDNAQPQLGAPRVSAD